MKAPRLTFGYGTLAGGFVGLALVAAAFRESAILGMLSIYTIGFYVQAAMYDVKMDRAVVLLAATGALSLSIDALSRALRARLRVGSLSMQLSGTEQGLRQQPA